MSTAKKKPINRGRIAANGYRLCDPLPAGEVLTDSTKKRWIIGDVIGCGGFGEIYLCRKYDTNDSGASSSNKRSSNSMSCVMKLDNADGPLFAEMNFYFRVARADAIQQWIKDRKLSFLGMPEYVASGIHDSGSGGTSAVGSNGSAKKRGKLSDRKGQYRFLVIKRFGDDLQKEVTARTLTLKRACDVTCQMIDVLQYVHSYGYIHADIKATNILQSIVNRGHYYLLDYGLADKYMDTNGVHREERADKKRANNGTVEFRSRDAHVGLISRRSDLECLSYNLLLWLSGTLPWISQLSDAIVVQQSKEYYMKNIDQMIKKCFNTDRCKSLSSGLKEFFNEINRIKYNDAPNYGLLKRIITKISSSSSLSKSVLSLNESDDIDDDNSEEENLRESPPKRLKHRSDALSPIRKPKTVTKKRVIKVVNQKISAVKGSKKSPVKRKSLNSTITISSDDGDHHNDDNSDDNSYAEEVNGQKPTAQMIAIQKMMQKKSNDLALKKKKSSRK